MIHSFFTALIIEISEKLCNYSLNSISFLNKKLINGRIDLNGSFLWSFKQTQIWYLKTILPVYVFSG